MAGASDLAGVPKPPENPVVLERVAFMRSVEMLFDRKTMAISLPRFPAPPPIKGYIAIYDDGKGRVVAGAIVDKFMAANFGCALIMIPGVTAREYASREILPPDIEANLREVFNVGCAWFTWPEQRIVLRDVKPPGSAWPPELEPIFKSQMKRSDLEVEITGYPRGRITLGCVGA